MNELKKHLFVVGQTRKAREMSFPSFENRRTFSVDCHRLLRGPYSGTSELLRTITPEVKAQSPELAQKHNLVILTVAPELNNQISDAPETLTSTALTKERTRFYSHRRTHRIAHGVIDFLLALTDEGHFGPFTIHFENVDHADELDREFLSLLLLRARPERLQLLLSSAEQVLDETLGQALDQFGVCVQAPEVPMSEEEALRSLDSLSLVERQELGLAYVLSDCTSDDILKRMAYEETPQEVRSCWHDDRAKQFTGESAETSKHGALLLHLEKGSDTKAALEAFFETMLHCINYGFYESAIYFADRALSLLSGFDQENNKKYYWYFTSMKTQALTFLGRTEEAEELCLQEQASTSDPVVQMRAAYLMSMLHTRYNTERDHLKAKVWSQIAISLAIQIEDSKERAFRTVFYKNGLALVELHLGNWEEALQLVRDGYERLNRELDSEEHLLHRSVLLYNQGQILSRQKRYEEALDVYNQVLEIDPNYPEYHFDKGNILNMLERYDEALECYRRALEVSAPFPEVYHNRALLLKKLGRIEEALADYNYLLELNPDYLETLDLRADLFLERGDLSSARRDVEHALKLNRENAQLHCKLGLIEMEEGRLDEAILAFTNSIQENAEYIEAWTNRAVAFFEHGQIEKAVEDLTSALRLGENATVLYNRAFAYQALEKWEEAVADLTEALTLQDADEAEFHYQRGLCYMQLGSTDKGIMDWKRHLDLVEGSSAYQNEIAEFAPSLA